MSEFEYLTEAHVHEWLYNDSEVLSYYWSDYRNCFEDEDCQIIYDINRHVPTFLLKRFIESGENLWMQSLSDPTIFIELIHSECAYDIY